MHCLDFRFITLLVLLLSTTVSAQIGKNYRDMRVNGPIIQMQTTQTMMIENEDGSINERMMDNGMAYIDQGRITKIEQATGMRSSDFKGIIEFEWGDDQLKRVRTYSQYGTSRRSLDRQNVTIHSADGKIMTENIFFGKDDLRATLSYEYSESPAGNEILQMTMYKPNELEPQGHFYIESDEWGEVLHIESVGKDTGLYVQRLENIGDSLFHELKIMSSRRERGTKDTIWTTTLKRYDEYGNKTFVESINKRRNPKGEGMLEMRMIVEIDYFQEGDDLPKVEPSADELMATWRNSSYNISLSLNGQPGKLGGFYTASTIRDKDPEIVEDGSDWIFRLRDSFTGSWEYNPTTEMITFRVNEKVIAKVKANLRFFELRLKPDEEYSASIILQKE